MERGNSYDLPKIIGLRDVPARIQAPSLLNTHIKSLAQLPIKSNTHPRTTPILAYLVWEALGRRESEQQGNSCEHSEQAEAPVVALVLA